MDVLPSSRPTSARGTPLSLAERVQLYCHQSTAANNASVLRSVVKPTAEEITQFLQQNSTSVYDDPALVRLLLTDSDYDAVCRETLNLQEAIAWHAKHDATRKQGSTRSLELLLLLSSHVFTPDELRAAHDLAASRGMDEVLRLFPTGGSVAATDRGAQVTDSPSNEGDQRPSVGPVPAGRIVDGSSSEVNTKPANAGISPSSSSAPVDTFAFQEHEAHNIPGDIIASTDHIDRISSGTANALLDATDMLPQNPYGMTIIDRSPSLAELFRPREQVADVVEYLTNPFHGDPGLNEEAETPASNNPTNVQASVTRDYARSTVEETIETAIHQTVNHQILTQAGEKAEGAPHIDDTPKGEEPKLVVVDVTPTPALLTAEVTPEDPLPSGIESIVRTIDIDLLDGDGADKDDLVFGEDALLLGELTSTPPNVIMEAVNHPLSKDLVVVPVADASKNLADAEILATTAPYKVGDTIEARYKGTIHYFPGTIAAFHAADGTFDVSYKDGDAETHVHGAMIRYPTASSPRGLLAKAASSEIKPSSGKIPDDPAHVDMLRVGDAVEVRYRGLNKYFPGEIAVVMENGRYDVRYVDGEYESDVCAAFIRRVGVGCLGRDPVAVTLSPNTAGTLVATTTAPSERTPKLATQDDSTDTVTPQAPAAGAACAELTEPQSLTLDRPEIGIENSHNRAVFASAAQQIDTPIAFELASVGRDEGEGDQVLDREAHQIEEPNAPSPSVESKKSQSSQRIHKSESMRDPSSRPLPVVEKCLTEGPNTIRPISKSAITATGDKSGAVEVDEVVTVTQTRLARTGSRRGDLPDKERGTRRPLSRTGSGTEAPMEWQISPTPRNSTADPTGYHIQQASELVHEITRVVPFDDTKKKTTLSRPVQEDSPTIASARALLEDHTDSDEDVALNLPLDLEDEAEDETLAVDEILHATTDIPGMTLLAERNETPRLDHVDPPKDVVFTSKKSTKKRQPQMKREQLESEPTVPALSASTLRYLNPQSRNTPTTARSTRQATKTHQTATPRATTASQRGRQSTRAENEPTTAISWKELEEWRNVDAILNRKRRVVQNGQVGGTEVPWGEEFAAIQSLKRFAAQYPDVLRDHIQSQLAEVVNSDSSVVVASRSVATKATSAARDALFLIKDLAFLLRHRLAPFLDSILPVVLPAVFHSQKRFLCDSAYEVLEALVTHCSSRRLVVALLRQALRFPRDDLRLVNLTCLYVEKCLAAMGVVAVEELLARCARNVLDAVAELLTCKSAACQSSLQKSLMALQDAVGEDELDHMLEDHLAGDALALVRKHIALGESATRGLNKSPSASPKKHSHQQSSHHNATPAKQAAALAVAANANGSMSILQRMLAQRQNRVVPAPE